MQEANKFHVIDKEIEDLDLSAASVRAQELTGLNQEQSVRMTELYRRFLCAQKIEKSYYLIPTGLINLFWIAHIADFPRYISDMQAVFQAPLVHYTSNLVYDSDPDSRDLHKLKFIETYARLFGQNPEVLEADIKQMSQFSDEYVEKYHIDMKEKFQHTTIENAAHPSFLNNSHNRIKPY